MGPRSALRLQRVEEHVRLENAHEAGVDVYKVSKLLGHADVRITEKIYAPICGKFLAGEASKLGRFMGPLLLPKCLDSPMGWCDEAAQISFSSGDWIPAR